MPGASVAVLSSHVKDMDIAIIETSQIRLQELLKMIRAFSISMNRIPELSISFPMFTSIFHFLIYFNTVI